MIQKLKLGIMKVGIWKLCVLYLYGGIYADTDTRPLKPIDKWDLYPFDEY